MNPNATAIIIDCNSNELTELCTLIKEVCPLLEIIGCYAGIADAAPAKDNQKPDIIIIDIDYCNTDVFHFLKTIDRTRTELVIVSELNDTKKNSSILNLKPHHLVKPFKKEQLIRRIGEAIEISLMKKTELKSLNRFWEFRETKIAIKDGTSILLVPAKHILFCESDNSTLTFYLSHLDDVLKKRFEGQGVKPSVSGPTG